MFFSLSMSQKGNFFFYETFETKKNIVSTDKAIKYKPSDVLIIKINIEKIEKLYKYFLQLSKVMWTILLNIQRFKA